MLTLTAPQNTIRYQFKGRPLYTLRNLATVPTKAVVASMAKYEDGLNPEEVLVLPETEALRFYYTNHVASVIRQRYHEDEPLGEALPLAKMFGSIGANSATRAFYYLLMICARESRYVQNTSSDFWNQFNHVFGDKLATFMQELRGHQAPGDFIKNSSPEVSIGMFVQGIQWVFYNGNFSSAYGGVAWGKITDVLVDYVYGKVSPEMMLDVVWTLAHNTGPIFNKGFLYKHQSNATLRIILDAQRAGQIPELLRDMGPVSHKVGGFVTASLDALQNEVEKVLGDIGGKYVDWFAVEALGSVGQYEGYKLAQAQAYGKPKGVAEKEKKNEALQNALKFTVTAVKNAIPVTVPVLKRKDGKYVYQTS